MSLIEIISWPFAKLLWLFNFTGNYAIAIFFFAIVVKLVTLPLSIKQQKTQIKGAKLRPKMAAIEKKYAGRTDRKTLEKKQKELMAQQQAQSGKGTSTSKKKQQYKATEKKQAGTNENGRLGNRPYARGRAFSEDHYAD